MKRYAVAFISFMDNEMHMEIIEANSAEEAVKSKLQRLDYSSLPDTLEEIKRDCFDCDSMIDCIEIHRNSAPKMLFLHRTSYL